MGSLHEFYNLKRRYVMKLRKDRREQRRREAVERNQRWSDLTPLEQLQELSEREVKATRQRAKISSQLDSDTQISGKTIAGYRRKR